MSRILCPRDDILRKKEFETQLSFYSTVLFIRKSCNSYLNIDRELSVQPRAAILHGRLCGPGSRSQRPCRLGRPTAGQPADYRQAAVRVARPSARLPLGVRHGQQEVLRTAFEHEGERRV